MIAYKQKHMKGNSTSQIKVRLFIIYQIGKKKKTIPVLHSAGECKDMPLESFHPSVS